MKKIILSIALMAGLNFVASAQEKTGVGIMSFSFVQGAASSQDVNSIQETVINAFVKTKRFNIVDRSKMDALKKEKELQKSEDFIDGSVIQQGISLGANYLISGQKKSEQRPLSYRNASYFLIFILVKQEIFSRWIIWPNLFNVFIYITFIFQIL